MGSEIGQYAENTVLFEAACSTRSGPAPGRRQPGPRGPGHRRLHHDEGVRRRRRRPVPRVLRGLDAGRRGDPREDGLRLAAPRHRERSRAPQAKALEFQGVVDKLFSLRRHAVATREESPIGLARRFRELAGFTDDEIDEIAEVSVAALDERKERPRELQAEAARRGRRGGDRGSTAESAGPTGTRWLASSAWPSPSPRSSSRWCCSTRTPSGPAAEAPARPARDGRSQTSSIEVDETTPIARVQSELGDPIVVRAESGAFEDTRRPRQLSEVAVNTALGRTLLRVAGPVVGPVRRRARRRRRSTLHAGGGVGHLRGRSAGAARLPGPPAAVDLQLPQPARLHRRRPTTRSPSIWAADDLSWEDLSALVRPAPRPAAAAV